jgi:hypothetical protein
MRQAALAALGLTAVLALPASAAGTSGPFAGQVRQDQTATHAYDNNPSGRPCVDLLATYTVTLHYVPSSDVLTLSAVTQTATGANGTASLTVRQGVCARFTVAVTGTAVADAATYAVTVTGDLLGPIGPVAAG